MQSWLKNKAVFTNGKSSTDTKPRGQIYFFAKVGDKKLKNLRQENARNTWIFESTQNKGFFEDTPYSYFRDQAGSILQQAKQAKLQEIEVHFENLNSQQIIAILIGFDVSAYNFLKEIKKEQDAQLPAVIFSGNTSQQFKKDFDEAVLQAQAINWARHLVSLPPNMLNPKTFAKIAKDIAWPKNAKCQIHDVEWLEKNNFGMHLAVGQGSQTSPCLVHLSYRPASKLKPLALVGKGITFDTGGLDLKPSGAMRLMKKDMGGAAAVFAVFFWAVFSKSSQPLDAYLSLAENSVSSKSFRPSDVIKSRSGLLVEIDNTDAEGRLVLGDALHYAVTRPGKDEPSAVIDVATLTGAIKVALGNDVAGLFSNDDQLAQDLLKASSETGDWFWRMPLVEKYFAALNSPFADFKNSTEGPGGAITAALFLQRFIEKKKWAHIDIFAWNDRPRGALSQAGGSGQAVQALIRFLQKQ